MGLAEPKRRVKIGLDPQNLNWGNGFFINLIFYFLFFLLDKSKLGYKLMKKMGWNEGKGLGANENGMVSNLKVKLKMNNHGVGATVKTSENWLSNSNDFEKLLAKLNGPNSDDDSKNPSPVIEIKQEKTITQPETVRAPESKPSRFSHRSKFRKMKQMASLESHSLNEILGLRKNEQSEINRDSSLSTEPSEIAKDNEFIVTKTSNVTIDQYFSKKLDEVSDNGTDNYLDKNYMCDEHETLNFIGFKSNSTDTADYSDKSNNENNKILSNQEISQPSLKRSFEIDESQQPKEKKLKKTCSDKIEKSTKKKEKSTKKKEKSSKEEKNKSKSSDKNEKKKKSSKEKSKSKGKDKSSKKKEKDSN
ncbi:PIN2/TERF1-interacting telomerase inhibitor 1 [Smittium culicis]|uniref:PIN2/TERF1-interacting telomerase inhibitor 1 n=1 Tax=Smittium culicis TaxID=133412 RepID=A0A1R1XCI2_9FUNG|nr:PIN2/TERF1-interacting telomerase inhibitor 1 [Smittium culicis]